MKWEIGDTCYFLKNNHFLCQGVVVAVRGSMIQIKHGDNAGLRLNYKRVFHTEEEAEGKIPRHIRSPHL